MVKISIQKYIDSIYSKKSFINCLSTNRQYTYQEFFNEAKNIALNIKDYGIKENDIVLYYKKNSLEYLKFFFSSLIGNFIFFPVDYSTTKEQLKKLELKFSPKLLIDNKFDTNTLIKENKINKNLNLDNNLSFLILTSGTTGEPKGILFKKFSLIKSSKYFSKLMKYHENQKIYHTLPMHYMAGLMNTFLAPLASGCDIFVSEGLNSLTLLQFWNSISKYKIDSLHITPSIANALIKLNEQKKFNKEMVKELNEIISTGSFLNKTVIDEFEKNFGIRLRSCYGTTELGGPLTCQAWEDTFENSNVGEYLDEIKVKTEKENVNDIYNSLFVKTDFMMEGYVSDYKDIIENNFSLELDDEDYFNSKDYAVIKDNKIYLKGRRKDIIKIGDEIISLESIENEIKKIELVEDVACITREEKILGLTIVCFCKFVENQNVIENVNNLNKILLNKLKKKELPSKIIPVIEIPKNKAGKIQKYKLEEIYL